MPNKTSQGFDELASLLAQDHAVYSLVAKLVGQHARFAPSYAKIEALVAQMGGTIRAAQILASVLGAERVIRQVQTSLSQASVLASVESAPVPLAVAARSVTPDLVGVTTGGFHAIPFPEAIEDLVSRRPMLAVGYRQAAEAYTRDHAYALAKSVDLSVTERVQKAVADHVAKGGDRYETEKIIESIGDWDQSYAETILRTNTSTSYIEGRMRQALDPEIQLVMPALRFSAIHDGDARKNHMAADGLIAAPDDPVWRFLKPPLGFRCRCYLEMVDRAECERLGILPPNGRVRPATIPPGAHPDEDFHIAA